MNYFYIKGEFITVYLGGGCDRNKRTGIVVEK